MSDTFTTSEGREVTPEQQAKMAEKIGKLIAMSEDENLTAEARASYAEKAETLMREYRVNEEHVIVTGSTQVLPIRYRIVLVEGVGRFYASEFQDAYLRIWREIRIHAGLEGHAVYEYDRAGDARLVVAVGYGYEMDIRLAQFLWTAAHLTFATRIDTKVNPALSDQENCYYMRGSGMERNDIANLLWGSDYKDGPAHGKVQKLYLAECAKRDETPTVGGRGFIAKRYRAAYAEGFVDQFGWRLRDARSAVDAKSGGLELHGRKERVQQAYWAEWPDKAPMTAEERAANDAKIRERQAEAAEAERLCAQKGACRDALKRAQKRAEDRGWDLTEREVELAKCRRHRPYEPNMADRERWNREYRAPERSAGLRAGERAASSVEFRRTAGERQHSAPSAERGAIGN
jgi:uncharacterized protein DUF2786